MDNNNNQNRIQLAVEHFIEKLSNLTSNDKELKQKQNLVIKHGLETQIKKAKEFLEIYISLGIQDQPTLVSKYSILVCNALKIYLSDIQESKKLLGQKLGDVNLKMEDVDREIKILEEIIEHYECNSE